jgi:Ser/Thr protein kinase RdoA (MazF antagonist)
MVWGEFSMDFLQEAVACFELPPLQAELLRHNENMVYCLRDDEPRFVLRIHRPREGFEAGLLYGERSALQVRQGELQVLERLRAVGLLVQEPLPNRAGELVSVLSDTTPATLLRWLAGATAQEQLPSDEQWLALAGDLAQMHGALSGLAHTVPAYDLALLERMNASFALSAQLGALLPDEHATVCAAMAQIEALVRAESTHWSVCHADLSKSNLIDVQGRLLPIDFSLCGWAPVAMDLGSLASYLPRPLVQQLWLRYQQESGVELAWRELELCFAWQVLLYLATQAGSVYQQDWFRAAMQRWCRTIFAPLAAGEPVLAIEEPQ